MPKSQQPVGFTRFVTLLRWTTAVVGIGWAALTGEGVDRVMAAIVLVAYAIYRSFRPLDFRRSGPVAVVSLTVEFFVALGTVVGTGSWQSPYIFALFTPVVAAGLSRGASQALRLAFLEVIGLPVMSIVLDQAAGESQVITWTGELLLVAVVASYGRTLLTRAEAATRIGERQAQQLQRANALLADLDRVAQDLSVSFDIQDSVRDAAAAVRARVPSDACVVLLGVDGTEYWSVALAQGVELPGTIPTRAVPAAVAYSLTNPRAVIMDLNHDGFDTQLGHAIYAPLAIGSRLVGLMALERGAPEFTESDRDAVSALAADIALDIDNARLFERLQARGAARERVRIARDLHDRLGQNLAYIAFELDRLSTNENDLASLRDDARAMLRELRETLSDLRTDVTTEFGLTDAIAQFLDRVQRRSGIEVFSTLETNQRLSVGQEREVWRIAQEAITNVERHADATQVTVRWSVSAAAACLEIDDDGTGLGSESGSDPGRPSYGMTGMRERAALLGAALAFLPLEPRGTRVRLELSATAYDAGFEDIVKEAVT